MGKEKIILSDYLEDVHHSGRIIYLITYAFIMLFPIVTSIYFKAWPQIGELLTACLGVVPLFWTVGFIEAFSYMPLLGAGGSYLGFITGNVTNLKVPVALQAMTQAEARQGTEEGDVISTIAIAVSSIVCVLIIVLFMILMVPLTPVFSSETLAPAFSSVLPALFGGLMIAFIAKDPKIGVPVIIFGSALFIAVPFLASIYPIVLPIMIVISVLLARFLYKKGKLNK